MIDTLKALHEEETQLRAANKFLAHRAALMGCTAGLDGGTRRGARRKAAAKKASATPTTTTITSCSTTPKKAKIEESQSSMAEDSSEAIL